MGTKDKVAHVGKKGLYQLGTGMSVEVEVVDYKNSYGKDRWLIKPVKGTGTTWTEQDIFAN